MASSAPSQFWSISSLWIEWLDTVRVRKLALVAERAEDAPSVVDWSPPP